MIETKAYAIQHRNGTFLGRDHVGFKLVADRLGGARWTRENAEALMPMLSAVGVNANHMRVVPAPACGCCGAWRHIRISEDRYGVETIRCEKHHLRLPCMVPGCGRTFAMTLFDSYEGETCCARHWRMAPRYMRDAFARVRRVGKRLDWPEETRSRSHRLWRRIITAIKQRGDVGGEGHIDVAEIEAMFGP